MTLLDLAVKNVKSNMKNYMLYFISTISCITIYFIFLSLKYAPATVLKAEASGKIASAITSVSFVIIIFIGVFIAMTNAFFVRSRKKEIGIYIFSGMHQSHVAALLFIESVLIGLFSVIIGIGLGVLLSKLATMVLLKMMGMEDIVQFFVAPRAIWETLCAFTLIFLVTSLNSAFMSYQFKIIELMQAAKSEERAPKHSRFKGFAGIILVLSGYGISQLIPFSGSYILPAMLLTLFTTITGTYFLFSAFTVMLLEHLRKKATFIFDGVNILSINHLLFRIQNNARAMATIAVLSATTITVLGTSLTMIKEMEIISQIVTPNQIQVISPKDQQQPIEAYTTTQLQNLSLTTSYRTSIHRLPVIGQLSPDSPNKPDKMYLDRHYYLIGQTAYNQALKMAGKEKEQIVVPLLEKETVALTLSFEDRFYETLRQNEPLNYDIELTQEDKDVIHLTSTARRVNSLLPCRLYDRTLVVADSVFERLLKKQSSAAEYIQMIGVTEPLKTKGFFKALPQAFTPTALENIDAISFGDLKAELNRDKGVNLFITLFICLIFVMASGSVIYFKQLTDAVGEVQKYQTLFKLGIHPEEIKETVSRQLLFMFGAPYLVAVFHSIFALAALAGLLKANLISIGITACFVYLLFYIGFYLGTKRSYLKIIWPREGTL